MHKDGPITATDPLPADLPLVQFDLRQMFLFVAAASGVMAVLVYSGGMSALALLLAVLVVAVHMVATMIGCRLRENAARRGEWLRANCDPDLLRPASVRETREHLPAGTSLGQRASPCRAVGWMAIAGALAGALAGGIVLTLTIGHRISFAGLVVGTISAAVLGAWLAFLTFGFWGISRHAWREAVTHQRQDAGRHRPRAR